MRPLELYLPGVQTVSHAAQSLRHICNRIATLDDLFDCLALEFVRVSLATRIHLLGLRTEIRSLFLENLITSHSFQRMPCRKLLRSSVVVRGYFAVVLCAIKC